MLIENGPVRTVAQTERLRPPIARGTTTRSGHEASYRKRIRVKEIFGCMKTVGWNREDVIRRNAAVAGAD